MKSHLLICAAVLLTGCATPQKPEPVVRPVEVKVPTPVLCKTKLPEERPLPSETANLGGDIFDLSKIAAMDLKELKAQVTEWMAAAKGCPRDP